MKARLLILVLLAAPARAAVKPRLEPSRRHDADALHQTLVFSIGTAVNGGLVGCFGPCLHAIEQRTGMSQVALGRAILLNRLLKLAGTFASTLYLQEAARRGERLQVPPRLVLAGSTAALAVCTLMLASVRSSPTVLRFALAICGLAYGATDNAFTQLALWSAGTARDQRFHVALLNAGFTLGA
eukprot:6447470-Prymnesium_polylepis.1